MMTASEDEDGLNEGHPNDEDLEESEEDATHGAEESDVEGSPPPTSSANEELEPIEDPDEDAAGE